MFVFVLCYWIIVTCYDYRLYSSYFIIVQVVHDDFIA